VLHSGEHMFDTEWMLTSTDIEMMRRSAAMAPLSKTTIEDLLDECQRLLAERQRIASVLAELPMSMAALRSALNELHRIVS